MSDKLEAILQSIKEIQQVTRAIYDRQEETDAKLEALSMDVHHIKGDVAGLKEDVATLKEDVAILKTDVALLKEGQQRHEKILETLALRSIEYETALRGLKKVN